MFVARLTVKQMLVALIMLVSLILVAYTLLHCTQLFVYIRYASGGKLNNLCPSVFLGKKVHNKLISGWTFQKMTYIIPVTISRIFVTDSTDALGTVVQ